MKSRILLAIAILLLVIGIVSFIRLSKIDAVADRIISENTSKTGSVIENQSTNTGQNNNPGVISTAELRNHDSRNDCWVAYKGKVYDITSFLSAHPGGVNAILSYCGTANEFEAAFIQQHGTSKAKMLIQVGILIGDFDIQGRLG